MSTLARGRLLAMSSLTRFFQGRLAESSREADEAVELARQAGDLEVLSWALVGVGLAAAYSGSPEPPTEPLVEAEGLCRDLGLSARLLTVRLARAHAALAQGSPIEAE